MPIWLTGVVEVYSPAVFRLEERLMKFWHWAVVVVVVFVCINVYMNDTLSGVPVIGGFISK
jgi:hypothetical protein